jgi:hypothetical protein
MSVEKTITCVIVCIFALLLTNRPRNVRYISHCAWMQGWSVVGWCPRLDQILWNWFSVMNPAASSVIRSFTLCVYNPFDKDWALLHLFKSISSQYTCMQPRYPRSNSLHVYNRWVIRTSLWLASPKHSHCTKYALIQPPFMLSSLQHLAASTVYFNIFSGRDIHRCAWVWFPCSSLKSMRLNSLRRTL